MPRRVRPIEVVKHVIWLAVAVGGTAYFAIHLPQLGAWGIAGLTIGGAMLTVYLLDRWVAPERETPLTRRLGDVAVLVALVAACGLLLILLLDGLRQPNPVRVAVAGLFLVTFARILRDYLRHLRGSGSRRRDG